MNKTMPNTAENVNHQAAFKGENGSINRLKNATNSNSLILLILLKVKSNNAHNETNNPALVADIEKSINPIYIHNKTKTKIVEVV